MTFLDFEKPIADLYDQLEKVKSVGEEQEVSINKTVQELEEALQKKREEVYANLTPWQRVQLSRHPERPYTLYYIEQMCESFRELHGDRNVRDDKAVVGGLGSIDGKTYMLIGQQKGVNTKMRQYRNFGMPNPAGYRKAGRLMRLAEKFDKPIVTLIDTPGAFPGIEAEEKGQAEAIAHNLYEMAQLKVPVLCIVIGEGASGGALGIGLGDRLYMMENTWYSVIAPESCSSILWRGWEHKKEAAEALKLTSDHMHNSGIVDGVIEEPLGGAHTYPEDAAKRLKDTIKQTIAELEEMDSEERKQKRIEKYANMGHYQTSNKKGKSKNKKGAWR